MQWFSSVEWASILVPDTPLLETFIRGSTIYLGTFLLLRFVLKRESGTVGITDLIVIVFIADAAQNGMAGDYHSLPDALLLIAVLVFWAYTLDRLAFRFPRLRRLLKPAPLPLVKDGVLLRENLRKEYITPDELAGQLRMRGLDDLSRVKRAYMESDGRISFVGYSDDERRRQKRTHEEPSV